MQDHGTIQRQDLSDLLGRPFGPEETTNECPKKDKHLCLLTLRVKFITELPTPSNGRDTNITRGLPRMSTNLDILLTRPPPYT